MRVFTGYSDDVVLSGSETERLDEYYAKHYLLSDGTTVKADYGQSGWEFSSTNPDAIIVAAVDLGDEGIDHTDERIPDWVHPSGYSSVLLIPNNPEIIASSANPFPDSAKDEMPILKFITLFSKEAGIDIDDMPSADDVKNILTKAGLWEVTKP